MEILKKIKLLPNAIKGYERSDPYRNGEYKFLRSYIKKNMIIFDVGANIGEYAEYISKLNPEVKIYCFEPLSLTFKQLRNKLIAQITKGKVVANNFGLSNEEKIAEMFIYEDLSGNNSLYFNPVYNLNQNDLSKEKIKLTTLNKYAAEINIPKIDFLKIDVEGHEPKVIEGASELIEKKLIKCIQFEYNSNCKVADSKFENVFNYLSKYGYKLYRLAIWGKIPVFHFHNNLENYKHANYVAILSE
jgi:FkbM family methyltransferase